MNYVDGNLVRGNYKTTTMDKAQAFAKNTGYVVGLANTLREVYPTIRPAMQGLGLLV